MDLKVNHFLSLNKENPLLKEKYKPMIIGKLDMHYKIKYTFCEKMLLIIGLAIYNTETIQV